MIKFLISSLLMVTSLLLISCGGSSSSLSNGNNELNIAAAEVIDNTIIPAANRFQQQVENLVAESNNFCSSGNMTDENLTNLQEHWVTTNMAWFQLLPYRFGPLVNSELLPTYTFIDSYRLRGTDYISTVRINIDSQLADNSEINAATFSNLSFKYVGLLALEVVLFEDAENQSDNNTDIVNEYQTNPRKCQLLSGYGNELLRRVEMVQLGWTTNYRGSNKSYRELVINNQLEANFDDETGESAIKKITVSVQEYYDYLGLRNVTLDVAQLSGTIWQAIAASADNTSELLSGTDSTELSLNRIMNNNRFEQSVGLLQENIQTLHTSLDEKNTVDMVAAAKSLDGNFKRELPEALNINLGINFSDGD